MPYTLLTRTGTLTLDGSTRVYSLGPPCAGSDPLSLSRVNAPRFAARHVRNVQLAPRVVGPLKVNPPPVLSDGSRATVATYAGALAILAWNETQRASGRDDGGSSSEVKGATSRVIFDHTAEVSDDGGTWAPVRVSGSSCKVGSGRLDGLHFPRAAAVGDVVLVPVSGVWVVAAVTSVS